MSYHKILYLIRICAVFFDTTEASMLIMSPVISLQLIATKLHHSDLLLQTLFQFKKLMDKSNMHSGRIIVVCICLKTRKV